MTAPEPLQEVVVPSSPALDPQMLDGLREALADVTGEFVAGLATAFEAQAVELMAELSLAAQQADVQRLGFAAHSLKGSSANVGGNRLAGLCAELEHWDGATDQLPAKVATIQNELDNLLAELSAYVAR